MTPNPVCYNGTNLPLDAIHAGHVSLGITPKDYRADTAQNWRAGISPAGAVVLYSNTYDLGLTSQALAEPRIWWTNPAGTIADFKLKITELISRLPERAGLNYSVFQTYEDAISWLHDTEGKYVLVNDDYPEYHIDGKYCIFNIESGLMASYAAAGLHIHNLANPNLSVGNQHQGSALSWTGFTLTNINGELNINGIGAEAGLSYNNTGHMLSVDAIAGTRYNGKNIVFEAIVRIPYTNGETTLFSLLDSNNNNEIVRFEWDPNNLEFMVHYPTLGSIVRFDSVTTPWTGDIHIVASIPASNDPEALSKSYLSIDGLVYEMRAVTGTDFEWNNSTYFQIGNNRSLDRPIDVLKSAKGYIVPLQDTKALFDKIVAINYPIVSALY